MEIYSHITSKGFPIQDILDTVFMKKTGGVFIELGAHDGMTQSNTAFLEFERGWTGVLIEPSPIAFELCKVNRPKSQCFSYACVSEEFSDHYVEGDFTGVTMASINGQRCNRDIIVRVPAKTLSTVLDEANIHVPIDFLSLDVEGYELNVLKGIQYTRHRPHYMLIEIYKDNLIEICDFLKDKKYVLLGNITQYNYTDNPYWDGTHNDYLFIDGNRVETTQRINYVK